MKAVRCIPQQAAPKDVRQLKGYIDRLPVDKGLPVGASVLYVDQDGSDAGWRIVHPACHDD